eukprot:6286999-Amphidinium_carterae.1
MCCPAGCCHGTTSGLTSRSGVLASTLETYASEAQAVPDASNHCRRCRIQLQSKYMKYRTILELQNYFGLVSNYSTNSVVQHNPSTDVCARRARAR